jgi:hypothetical protein
MFPGRPRFEALLPHELGGGTVGIYAFTEPFQYNSPQFGSGAIEVGFTTDFASIPAFFRRYMDDDDPRILCAALRHDHRYSLQNISRHDADLELVEGMEALGARWDQRQAVYRAVRMFGGSHWKT